MGAQELARPGETLTVQFRERGRLGRPRERPRAPGPEREIWYVIAGQPAPAPHLARTEGRAAGAMPRECMGGLNRRGFMQPGKQTNVGSCS